MTSSETQGHLEEIYGVEVSPELISTVKDGVIEEVQAWQGRPREKVGRSLSDDRAELARQLGACDSVLPIPGGDSEGDLYDQRDRVA